MRFFTSIHVALSKFFGLGLHNLFHLIPLLYGYRRSIELGIGQDFKGLFPVAFPQAFCVAEIEKRFFRGACPSRL